jgi:hypothetical protein
MAGKKLIKGWRRKMDKLSAKEEQILKRAIHKVAHYNNSGLTPTDALIKVAREEQLTPTKIQRAAETFNKSKSVDHFIKTAAGDDRALPFPIANAQVAINAVYTPGEKEAKITAIPSTDFSRMDFTKDNEIEKVANAAEAITVEKLPKHSIKRMIDKHASLCERFTRTVDRKVGISKNAFKKSIEKACEEVHKVPANQLKKVAQLIRNGYHKDNMDEHMLAVLEKGTNRKFPEVQKTANAAIFPDCEPYISLNTMKEAAFTYMRDTVAAEQMRKEAGASQDIYEAYMQSRQLGGPGQESTDVLLNIVDPKVIQNLEKQKARRRLMELVIHDEDISQYDINDVMRAYNSTMGSVPNALDKPTALKNLILKNLESKGRKDVFELGQEAKLNKDIGTTGAYGSKELI